ncbi:MAG: methyltransferase domain-containing protein [Rickettsiales bacterium]|jgi:tRNA1(Val) A37 N6-methylase TrmN6|nr:methyltransferase domain-containing protein [Rickettsiales bacterium]
MPTQNDIFTICNGRVKMTGSGYRTTEDAVLLADAVAVRPGAAGLSVLDVGIGPGGASLALLNRVSGAKITGVDISEDMIARAGENAAMNGREIELIRGDIFTWRTARLFDVVMTNPPYFSGSARKDNSHHNIDIYKWVVASVRRLRARGYFYAIAATGVFDKIIAALVDAGCGAITLTDAGGGRVIVAARKNVKTPAAVF